MKRNYLLFIVLFVCLINFNNVKADVHLGANGTLIWGMAFSTSVANSTNFTYSSTIGNTSPSPFISNNLFINRTKIVASKTRPEKVMALEDSGATAGRGRLFILNCTNECSHPSHWNYIANYTAGVSGLASFVTPWFDIESLSNGDIMLVFGNFTGIVGTKNKTYYCIWNGSAWWPSPACGPTFSPDSTNEILLAGLGTPESIALKEKDNKLIMVATAGTLDTNDIRLFSGAVWDGTAWVSNQTLSRVVLDGIPNAMPYAIAWENQSGDGLVIFDETPILDGIIQYVRFNSTNNTWDPTPVNATDTGSGRARWIATASDPNSNRISIIVADSESDAHIFLWKYDNFTEGFTTTSVNPIDNNIEATTSKGIVTMWSNSTALYTFVDSNAENLNVLCWSPTYNFTSVTAGVGGSNVDDVDEVMSDTSIIGNSSIIARGSIAGDLILTRWNGSDCTSTSFERIPSIGSIESNRSVRSANNALFPFNFWFAFDKFIPMSSPADTTPPLFYLPRTNYTEISQGEFVTFSANWTDETALDTFIFSSDNGTGIFSNHSAIKLIGTANVSNITIQLLEPPGTNISWRIFANDSSNNINIAQNSTLLSIRASPAGSGCGYVNNPLLLSKNIITRGTCFIINSSGVMINASNYNITGNLTGFGVNNTNFNDFSIKDLGIFNFTIGIFLNNTKNNSVSNLLINDTIGTNAVYAEDSYQLNLSNNRFDSLNPIKFISLFNVNNSLIEKNTINSLVTRTVGVYLLNSSYNNITSNNITSRFIGVYFMAIVIEGANKSVDNIVNSIGNNILFNTIGGGNVNTVYIGINLTNARQTNISFNNITPEGHSTSSGVSIDSSESNIIDKNNLFFTIGGNSIDFQDSFKEVNYTNITGNMMHAQSFAIRETTKATLSPNYILIAYNNITTYDQTAVQFNPGIFNISSNNITVFTGASGIRLSDVGNEFIIFSNGVIDFNNIRIETQTGTFSQGGIMIRNNTGSINVSYNVINTTYLDYVDTFSVYSIKLQYLTANKTLFFNNNITPNIISDEATASFYNLTIINGSSEIFYPNLSFYAATRIDTRGNLTISKNMAFVNASKLTAFNTTANITFRDTSYNSLALYRVQRDAVNCPAAICTKLEFNKVKFQVTGFSELLGYNTSAVINTAPTNVTLIEPSRDNRTLSNRTVAFSWFNSSDSEDDPITYNLLVDDANGFTSPEINVTILGNIGTSTTYFSTTELNIDTVYYWKIIANDTTTNSTDSELRNFTIASTVSLALQTSNIDFGAPGLGDTINTTSNNPNPIIIRNDGNVLTNVNISLIDDLWIRKSAPSAFLQYKIDNTTDESGSFNWTGSITVFTNIPLSNSTIIDKLNYSDMNDTAEIDIQITVPTDEPAGNRSAIIELTGWAS